jgi:hypothetical protein
MFGASLMKVSELHESEECDEEKEEKTQFQKENIVWVKLSEEHCSFFSKDEEHHFPSSDRFEWRTATIQTRFQGQK